MTENVEGDQWAFEGEMGDSDDPGNFEDGWVEVWLVVSIKKHRFVTA